MAALIAIAAVAAATPLAVLTGRRVGLVDHPGALKVHAAPVPVTGGVVVVAGWLAVSIGAGAAPPASLMAAALAALALGIADDMMDLGVGARVAGGLGVGAVLAIGVRPDVVAPLAVAASVALALGAINGVNLLDGLDGLAPGTCALAALGLGLVAAPGPARTSAFVLAGALAGFLVWNRAPARIFLGDGGAYALGATLGGLAILTAAGRGWGGAAAALLCLGMVALEPADAIARRVRARAGLTTGDREHTYDRLVARGWDARAAVAMTWARQGVWVAAGVLAVRRPWVAVLVAMGAVAMLILPARTRQRRRSLR